MTTDRLPVVFVHGLWLHADSWSPWVELFRDAGYDAQAPGWPGDSATVEETRAHPERIAGIGIDAVVSHYAELIRGLDTPPVVVGHSFGGLIAQRLLGENLAAAAVALDPAPIKGVIYLPPSSLRVASVALRNPANRSRAVALSRDQFRYGFGNALPERESDELYERWAMPSPGRPLFEAAVANLVRSSPAKVATGNAGRGPLLLTLGGQDHTVGPAVVRTTAKLYRRSPAVTDLKEYPDRGHSLGIDSGWRTIADDVLAWLKSRGF
ncbi:alpha/beta hydrolase [Jiangella endophytica]|uniref:alpha/beta hydrolase n=1 Tax=Jiangella endophytica TaxID=1623398 RepID=UPI000E34DD2E|nr:alpha/beta fold hydrolase [Jiangella endophytica]